MRSRKSYQFHPVSFTLNSLKKDNPQETLLLRYPMGWCAAIIGCSAVIISIFHIFPNLDNAVSALFFTTVNGRNSFPMEIDPFWAQIRYWGINIPTTFGILIAIWALYKLVLFRHFKKYSVKAHEFLIPMHGLLSAIIGPIIITNVILKPNWGRPRPRDTIDFGGEAPYVFPGEISDYCTGNCSFVSGEATGAFWMLWIVPFLPEKWRKLAGFGILSIATTIAFLRITFGRHFLSDVILAGMVALFAIGLSAALLQSRLVQQWIAREEARPAP